MKLLLLFNKLLILFKTKITCKSQLFVVIYNMPTVLTRSMKKIMEHVLQESAKVGHIGSSKWLEQPKINLKVVTNFHSGEQNELEDVTKNIKL
jgi:hypothetical protein